VSEGVEREVLNRKLKAAKSLTQQEKFRWVLGKRTEFSKEGNTYGEIFTHHELERLLKGLIVEDLQAHEILALIETNAHSVKEIAQRLTLPPSVVLQHLTALRRRGLAKVQDITQGSPRYITCRENEKRHGS
jgi:DNA-binding transcriptional ArsR family regulator